MTIIKNEDERQEFVGLISDAFQEVMVPALDNMEARLKEELASKEDLKELGMKVDSLDKKFDAQQNRLDKHNNRIEALEKIHPQGKHQLATG